MCKEERKKERKKEEKNKVSVNNGLVSAWTKKLTRQWSVTPPLLHSWLIKQSQLFRPDRFVSAGYKQFLKRVA